MRHDTYMTRSATFAPMAESGAAQSAVAGHHRRAAVWGTSSTGFSRCDPISKRRLYLTEFVPAGPKAGQVAERIRTRLLGQLDERRSPRTRATIGQLLDRWLQVLDVDPSTRRTYDGYIRKHIRPVLGSLPLTRLDVETLDSFYAELRRCREHCDGRPHLQHRTSWPHRCDEHDAAPCRPPDPAHCEACRRACKTHMCRGLADSTPSPTCAARTKAAPSPRRPAHRGRNPRRSLTPPRRATGARGRQRSAHPSRPCSSPTRRGVGTTASTPGLHATTAQPVLIDGHLEGRLHRARPGPP